MILGYARVSTVQQADDDRGSLQSQEDVIRGYAMARGTDKFGCQIFVDAGVSGGTLLSKRPAGADLLKTARRGDTVIAAKLDRMFRNSMDALVTAEQFKEKGIHLVLFDLGQDPITSDGMAKLVFTIFAALADAERTRINERIAEGKAAKRAKGGLTHRFPAYGYRRVGHGREAMVEIDPQEQQVIERIKREVGQGGYTYDTIASRLAADGLMRRNGKPFTRGSIYEIAHREVSQ